MTDDRIQRAFNLFRLSVLAVRHMTPSRWIVRSQHTGKWYQVHVASGGAIFCDCYDSSGRGHICKHALASAGAPALVAIMQVRRAESYYELAFIEAAHSAMLNDIAPAFRSIFNAELLHAKRRLSDTIPEAA